MDKIKLDTISSTFFFEMPMTVYKFPHEITLHTFKKKKIFRAFWNWVKMGLKILAPRLLVKRF